MQELNEILASVSKKILGLTSSFEEKNKTFQSLINHLKIFGHIEVRFFIKCCL
jgi:hypothetical protein